MIKKIWKDPVWSKVIAAIIIAIISVVYAKIKSTVLNISFQVALKQLIDLKINIVYVICLFIGYLIICQLFKKRGYYSRKQEQLRQFNKSHDTETGLLFRWTVYFDGETPFIDDLSMFCTKHGEVPVRFMENMCPIRECPNSYRPIDESALKNIIESDLIAHWDKIK
jgi:hypothetical protein